jgi:hypothetical protein
MLKFLERYKVLIGFVLFALAMGFWGYARVGSSYTADPTQHPFWQRHLYPTETQIHPLWTSDHKWLEALRCLICTIGLIRLYDIFQPGQDPIQLVFAQILVPGIAAVSAAQLFLVGVRKDLRTAMARSKTKHTVVCGIGDVGMQVIQNLRGDQDGDGSADGGDEQEIVAIDLRDDSPGAATCEKSGVPVLKGDAKNREVLTSAGVHRAQMAIISTGSDSENMDIALQIKEIRDQAGASKHGRIQVLAEMRTNWMHKRLMASATSTLGSEAVDLRLFNPFTDAARMLIKRLHLPPGPEFEAQTFVIVGFGLYGREIALHLIRACPVALNEKLKIIIFDEKADEEKQRFSITDPAAGEFAALEFVKASVAPGSADLAEAENKLMEAGRLLGVAVALGDDQVSLAAALELRSLLDRKEQLHVPIYVRLEHYRKLGELVRGVEGVSCFGSRVEVFGTLEETLSPEVLLGSELDIFAQALQAEYLKRPKDAKNPNADKEWPELSEIYKMSNRWRADHTPLLLEVSKIHAVHEASPAVLELDEDQIEQLAQLEHRRYTTERRMVENRPRKEWRDDPALYDWKDLKVDNRQYNRDEVAKIPEIMKGLGIELRPVRNVLLYGMHLAEGVKEIDRMAKGLQKVHYSLIADLGLDEAIQQAARALRLVDEAEAQRVRGAALSRPSLSLWLISDAIPREFAVGKPENKNRDRADVIRRANGWAPKSRITFAD